VASEILSPARRAAKDTVIYRGGAAVRDARRLEAETSLDLLKINRRVTRVLLEVNTTASGA